jgi:hypothetical protein
MTLLDLDHDDVPSIAGFRFAATAAGIKKNGKPDLSLVVGGRDRARGGGLHPQPGARRAGGALGGPHEEGRSARPLDQRRQRERVHRKARDARGQGDHARGEQGPRMQGRRGGPGVHRRHRGAAPQGEDPRRPPGVGERARRRRRRRGGPRHHDHRPMAQGRQRDLQGGKEARHRAGDRQGRRHDPPRHGHHLGLRVHGRGRVLGAPEDAARAFGGRHLQQHQRRRRHQHQRHHRLDGLGPRRRGEGEQQGGGGVRGCSDRGARRARREHHP